MNAFFVIFELLSVAPNPWVLPYEVDPPGDDPGVEMMDPRRP